jgi:hypothetical protein
MACQENHPHHPSQCEGPEHPDILDSHRSRSSNAELVEWASHLPPPSKEQVDELNAILNEAMELDQLVAFRSGQTGIIPDPSLPRAATREARDAFVAYLTFEAEFSATRSRDFGRGFAHAISVLKAAPAECDCCPLPGTDYPVGQWWGCPDCGKRWRHKSEREWTTRSKD